METIIYSGSYGFTITIETGKDLTDASTIRLRIRTPSQTNIDRALTSSDVLEPASDGIVTYEVQSTDFLMPGTYHLQVFDETGGSLKLASEILKLKVKPSLDYVVS